MRKIILPIVCVFISLITNAQDSTKSFALSGSVDGYYRYNFNNAPVDASGAYKNNYTSFTNSQNSFELGMASLRGDATALSGKVGATIDLGFGRRAEEFSYNDGSGYPVGTGNGYNTLATVKQAYVSLTPGKAGSGVKFTLGKWATHVGYEVVDAYANRNYSMSYLFSFGPFSHTGLKAEYSKKTWSFMLGISNPMDNVTTTSTTKVVIAQISNGTKDGKFKGYLNYCGSSNFQLFDFVGTGTISSKFSVGLDATYKDSSAASSSSSVWGTAVYLNLDPKPAYGFTLRCEYYDNTKGGYNPFVYQNVIDYNASVFAATLSLNYKVGPFILVPELRLDNANQNIFESSNGSGTKSSFTGLVAGIYKF